MERQQTSLFANGLIWFGAGVSIAEILTGTYFAPLGFKRGFLAIIIGHIIGCGLLFLAGAIGGTMHKSSMETVKICFGKKGGLLFCFLNVIQLVGWTAIMIYDGSLAAVEILHIGRWIWCIIIGALIIVWILIGIQNLNKVNFIAIIGLFLLTMILCVVIFRSGLKTEVSIKATEAITFGAAIELSVAMPLSWLPVIGDYTREAKNPMAATAVSAIVYGIVSTWMYLIGMGAAIFVGESDIAQIMIKAGLGIVGLMMIIFSTVTTTFLDAFSAGVSSVSLFDAIEEKWAAIFATVLGVIGAVCFPMDNITEFLYFIGSIFAPMIAVQIADYFFLFHRTEKKEAFQWIHLIIWMIGFFLYRYLMKVDFILGSTLPDMILTIMLCIIADKVITKQGAMQRSI